GDGLAALVDVARLRVHHRPEYAAARMRRLTADGGHPGARERAARYGQPERERACAADDLLVLEGRVHALVRQRRDKGLEPLLTWRRIEVLADRADGMAVLLLVGAGANVEHAATLQLLERRLLEHELPPAAAGGEAHRYKAARLDAHDHALGERRVAHRVAGRETRHVLARLDLALPRRAVARPRRRSQPLALDVRVGQLVEEA